MSDNPQGTGPISLTDAVSLLNTPPADTVTEEITEAQEPQQPETEAYEPEAETADATVEEDYEEDDEGEDADSLLCLIRAKWLNSFDFLILSRVMGLDNFSTNLTVTATNRPDLSLLSK